MSTTSLRRLLIALSLLAGGAASADTLLLEGVRPVEPAGGPG